MSLDDMHDEDARSVAASSHLSSHLSVGRTLVPRDPALRRAQYEMSRESSKESSNSESDDHGDQRPVIKSRVSQSSMSSDTSRLSQVSEGKSTRASTPPLSSSPALRRGRMVKSFSQDASHEPVAPSQMTSSSSDSALHAHLHSRLKGNHPTLDEVALQTFIHILY